MKYVSRLHGYNPMHFTTSERLKRIQQHLGVSPDGVLGGETLSALENRLLPLAERLTQVASTTTPANSDEISLTLSQKGIDLQSNIMRNGLPVLRGLKVSLGLPSVLVTI